MKNLKQLPIDSTCPASIVRKLLVGPAQTSRTWGKASCHSACYYLVNSHYSLVRSNNIKWIYAVSLSLATTQGKEAIKGTNFEEA